MGKIRKIIGALLHAPERFDLLADRIEDVKGSTEEIRMKVDSGASFLSALRNTEVLSYDDLRIKLEEIYAAEESFVRRTADQAVRDPETLEVLNRGLHQARTMLGDRSRLHIAETAAMNDCVFQPFSGGIWIGEYAFAGINVHIIAEKIDEKLTGLPRMESTETDGCDIRIGDGVYLGSASTVLGPCLIGSNSVVLPGSLVIPGTKIPENSIWGGVPAVEIRKIQTEDHQRQDNHHLVQAMKKNKDLLFMDGWSGRMEGWWKVPGRKLLWDQGKLLTTKSKWLLEYYLEKGNNCALSITGPLGEMRLELSQTEGRIPVEFPLKEGTISELIFSAPNTSGLTIALSGRQEEEEKAET